MQIEVAVWSVFALRLACGESHEPFQLPRLRNLHIWRKPNARHSSPTEIPTMEKNVDQQVQDSCLERWPGAYGSGFVIKLHRCLGDVTIQA
jgi:hypothetical protein